MFDFSMRSPSPEEIRQHILDVMDQEVERVRNEGMRPTVVISPFDFLPPETKAQFIEAMLEAEEIRVNAGLPSFYDIMFGEVEERTDDD